MRVGSAELCQLINSKQFWIADLLSHEYFGKLCSGNSEGVHQGRIYHYYHEL
jgi:hypothetical protein